MRARVRERESESKESKEREREREALRASVSRRLSAPLLSAAERSASFLLTLCNGPCISRLSGGAH